MVHVGRRGGRVEDEAGLGARRRVGGCFGEGEQFLVAPRCRLVPGLDAGRQRGLPCEAFAEEGFAG